MRSEKVIAFSTISRTTDLGASSCSAIHGLACLYISRAGESISASGWGQVTSSRAAMRSS